MPFTDDLKTTIENIAKSRWEETEGRVVPEVVGLGNKGVKLDATFLYADLEDSTDMAMNGRQKTAEVYKAFLACCSKIIILRGGSVRSFDGDRIMGVFIGNIKNTSAAKAALNIKYVFNEILLPIFKNQYEVFKNGTLKLNYSVGIDTSSVLVAQAGIRNNNDLVWVGQAPNIAAKLSTLRESGYNSYITKAVYDSMADEAKISTDGKEMWESRTWSKLPANLQSIYRSSWRWQP